MASFKNICECPTQLCGEESQRLKHHLNKEKQLRMFESKADKGSFQGGELEAR